jgi:hypothetical protein
MRRSREVRLADFQVDDFPPTRFDSARPEQNVERSLSSKRSGAAGKLRHPRNLSQDCWGANESPDFRKGPTPAVTSERYRRTLLVVTTGFIVPSSAAMYITKVREVGVNWEKTSRNLVVFQSLSSHV